MSFRVGEQLSARDDGIHQQLAPPRPAGGPGSVPNPGSQILGVLGRTIWVSGINVRISGSNLRVSDRNLRVSGRNLRGSGRHLRVSGRNLGISGWTSAFFTR